MEVSHEVARHRFVIRLPEGEGELIYRTPAPGLIDLLHTEVNPALRGRGLANLLAEAAFRFAREAGVKVIVTCPFVQRWLDRHPEQRDLVVPAPPRGR